jgi:molybdenum cofactor cytidylyltransferase
MHGKNKLLEHIDGTPMIRRVVQAALKSKVDEVVVVLGWEADKIRETLADLPCSFVLNKEFETGQSSSVKAGIRAVSETTRALLVLPGDVARVDSRSISMVADAYCKTGSAIVVAGHDGEHGHPILFDRSLFHEIEQINEKTFGLKSVVKQHETEVRFVEVDTRNVLRDVDTPQDLKELRSSNTQDSTRG